MHGYLGNIEKLSLANTNFRQVLFTGQHAQLVVMHLNPGEDIGSEVHTTTDQFIRVEKGSGIVVMDGVEHTIGDGSAFVIPAGMTHNIINTSTSEPMKLYTIYAPPHHKDDTVHATKMAAEQDTQDHL